MTGVDDPGSWGGPRALNPRELLDCVLSHGVEFVVTGGFSVAAHGVVRATKGVDMFPNPSPENRTRLAAALRDLGAVVDVGDLAADELPILPDEDGLAGGDRYEQLVEMKNAVGREEGVLDIAKLRAARGE